MNAFDLVVHLLLLVPAVLIAIPLHEIGHVAAAYYLGDKSVRYFGYFKPDPRRYMEPIGVLAVVIALVGWGRRAPIQTNRINTTRQKVIYELAGPAANLALALVLGRIVLALANLGLPFSYDPGPGLFLAALYVIVFLNLSLFAFNLLPIPGLDGWNILEALLRRRYPKFFFGVAMRRREIWAGCAIAFIVVQFLLGINLLAIVMTPFFEPASLISLNGCDGYRIPNLAYLFPCRP